MIILHGEDKQWRMPRSIRLSFQNDVNSFSLFQNLPKPSFLTKALQFPYDLNLQLRTKVSVHPCQGYPHLPTWQAALLLFLCGRCMLHCLNMYIHSYQGYPHLLTWQAVAVHYRELIDILGL